MEYREPTRIITYENCVHEERILQGNPCQAGFNNSNCMILKKGGYLVLDFGREIHGGVTVTTMAVSEKAGRLRIVFGESVMEALSTIGEKNATNDHSVRDMAVEMHGWSTMTFGQTGFRFVKIEAVNADFELKAVKAKTVIRDIPYIGSFTCNDERLNEIWKVGAYTVQLVMQDYLWDGIKRDRDVWIGDMHPEVSTIRTVFGKQDVVEKSLDYVRNDTPDGHWMNGIPTYSMWWVIIQHDWYMHFGNLDYLRQQEPCLKSIMTQSFEWIDQSFCFESTKKFLDWSSRGLPDEEEGIKAVFCLGLTYARKLFQFLGDTDYSQKCDSYLQKICAEPVNIPTNKRISALLTLADRNYPGQEAWKKDNTGKEMSCFMGYYVLLAKAKLGQLKEALDIIREYWGGMLDKGATTFWEDFDVEWLKDSAGIDEIVPEGKKDIHGDFGKFCYTQFRHSLCHGWASGPTAFLSEQLAGIRILEPGCKALEIHPQLAGLEWWNICYPTPYGIAEIKCRNKNGTVQTEISAPGPVKIIQRKENG